MCEPWSHIIMGNIALIYMFISVMYSLQAVCFLPKDLCNVRQVEIARAVRLCKTTVQPIFIKVPRTKVNLVSGRIIDVLYMFCTCIISDRLHRIMQYCANPSLPPSLPLLSGEGGLHQRVSVSIIKQAMNTETAACWQCVIYVDH